MKNAFKVIYWILGIFLCFILLNLLIGTIKYGGVSKYSEMLNNKDWQSSVSKVSIFRPKTRFSIFYQDVETKATEAPTETSIILTGEDTQQKEINRNPYDPDYEDEFNSFFGGKSAEFGNDTPTENIEEDLGEAGFKLDE